MDFSAVLSTLRTRFKELTPDLDQFNKGLTKVQSNLEKIGQLGSRVFTTLSAQLLATTKVADPVRFQQFTLAMRDLAGVVGQILAPVLEKITKLVRSLADWIINLTPAQKKLAAAVVTVALALSGAAMILPKVISGVISLTTAMLALDATTGGILLAVGLIATALLPLITNLGETNGVLGDLAKTFKPITDALKSMWGVIESSLPALEELARIIGDFLKPVIENAAKVLRVLTDLMSTQADTIKSLIEPFSNLLNAIAPLFEVLVKVGGAIAEILGPVLEIISLITGEILKLLMEALTPLVELMSEFLVPIFESWLEILKDIAVFLREVVRATREFLGLQSLSQSRQAQDRERRSSVGAGGRQASFMSGEEVQRKAILAAVMSPAGDPNRIAEAQRREMIEQLKRVNRPDSWSKDRARNN